jgi:hypothetical protein
LGLRLWDFSIFDNFSFEQDEPPAYLLECGTVPQMAGGTFANCASSSWTQADRELRRQEREARRTKAAPPSPPPP